MKSERIVVAWHAGGSRRRRGCRSGAGTSRAVDGVELSIEAVAGRVHMVQRPGGGGNIGVFVGP